MQYHNYTPNQYVYCAQCGKNRYSSREEAENVAEYRQEESGVALSVYPCPYSQGYHLTSR